MSKQKQRAPKRKRTIRRKAANIVLTIRDISILIYIGMCGYMSSKQIAREFFPSEDRARRRIRALYDNGYIDLHLASSTLPNLTTLTTKGREAVEILRPELQGFAKTQGPINLISINHHIALTDVRLYLASLVKSSSNAKLLAWSGPSSQRQKEFGLEQHYRLCPDGFCELKIAGNNYNYAIELDCGTESINADSLNTIKTKLERYKTAKQDGVISVLWIVVKAASSARIQSITVLVKAMGLGRYTAVFDHSHTTKRPLLDTPENVVVI